MRILEYHPMWMSMEPLCKRVCLCAHCNECISTGRDWINYPIGDLDEDAIECLSWVLWVSCSPIERGCWPIQLNMSVSLWVDGRVVVSRERVRILAETTDYFSPVYLFVPYSTTSALPVCIIFSDLQATRLSHMQRTVYSLFVSYSTSSTLHVCIIFSDLHITCLYHIQRPPHYQFVACPLTSTLHVCSMSSDLHNTSL